MNMKWTDEQIAIAQSQARCLVVEAGAGCAKTSTLELLAKQHPNERMLYLAFNKSVAEEAQRRFPNNVHCKTTHGMAFARFGSRYSAVGKLGEAWPTQIASALGIENVQAGQVLGVIGEFCNSADPEICAKHALAVVDQSEAVYADVLAGLAKKVWEMMTDVSNLAIKIPHDGYLKLFQLSKPRLNTDVILLDEAQDANPVILDIIEQQHHARKVFVGDSHQSIYGFRGAVDALRKISDAERLTLTGSFRFGPGIANLATALLRDWGKSDFPIRGLGKHDSVFSVERTKSYAFLARTNAAIFDEAVRAAKDGRPFIFVGGIQGYRFDQILDCYHMMDKRISHVKDAYLKSFGSFDAMVQFSEEMDDRPLKSLIKVVREHGTEIPGLIEQIKSQATVLGSKESVPKSLIDRGLINFSTVHKAKGLEWDSVVLPDDFVELEMKEQKDGPPKGPSKEEINLMYVAMTRARRCLEVPATVKQWLRASGQRALLSDAVPRPADEAAPAAESPEAPGVSEVQQGHAQDGARAPGSVGLQFKRKIVPTRIIEDEDDPDVRLARATERANALFSVLADAEAELRQLVEESLPDLSAPLSKWFEARQKDYTRL